jgi:phosphomannomutase/phosphoglucomutase
MKFTLFGTSGIRGDAERLFTNQFCFDIGRAFVIFLDNHRQEGAVAIGMDPRGSSPRIKDAIISGLTYEGREVKDEGATPVPSINYVLNVSEYICAGVMVSGSHIKPNLNGVKFFAFDNEILKIDEREISDIYASISEKVKYQKIKDPNLIEDETRANDSYQDYLVNNALQGYPKWKVAVDPGNGAQSDTMPQVLERLGMDVVEINCTIQGQFFSRDTEVEREFEQLKKEVYENQADFGIGYDSDGDRCIFVDEKGNLIPGDYTGALLALHFSNGKVVTPINSSQVIDKLGLEVIRTQVGSPFVVEAMIKNKCSFGYEANGGCIFKDMYSRDGGRTTIEILNIMKKEGKSLSKIVDTLPRFYLSRDKVDYKWELKNKIIAEARKTFRGKKTEELDGLKIWLDDTTWILFRSSSNAPEFRIFAESDDKKKSEELLQKGLDFVSNIIAQSGKP